MAIVQRLVVHSLAGERRLHVTELGGGVKLLRNGQQILATQAVAAQLTSIYPMHLKLVDSPIAAPDLTGPSADVSDGWPEGAKAIVLDTAGNCVAICGGVAERHGAPEKGPQPSKLPETGATTEAVVAGAGAGDLHTSPETSAPVVETTAPVVVGPQEAAAAAEADALAETAAETTAAAEAGPKSRSSRAKPKD